MLLIVQLLAIEFTFPVGGRDTSPIADPKVEIAIELARLSDVDDIDGIRGLLHPDAVMWGPEGWPERGPMRGRDAVLRQFERLAEDYSERHSEVDEIAESGDRLVGRLRWHVRAAHSEIESDLEVWFATRFLDGKLIEIRYVWTRDEAMGTAGLAG